METPEQEEKGKERENKEEKKQQQQKGLPGLKSPDPDSLPREYLTAEQHKERDLKEGLYGDFTQARDEMVKEAAEKKDIKDEGAMNWLKSISAKAGRDMAYYAGLTSYDIKFDDGKVIKFDRISPIDYQWDELEDLRAEIEGNHAMDDNHELTRREQRIKTRLLEQLKAKYYLINAKTREPMSADIKAHVRDSNELGCILDACVLTSLHKAVVGKNLEVKE